MVAEGVVAPRHVLELLLDQPVVGRVDDALLLPRAPWMGARGSQRDAARVGQREQAPAALVLALERVMEILALAGPYLHLRGNQLACDRLRQQLVLVGPASELLENVGQRQGVGVE